MLNSMNNAPEDIKKASSNKDEAFIVETNEAEEESSESSSETDHDKQIGVNVLGIQMTCIHVKKMHWKKLR